jgi:hypothetical protein
MEAYLQSEVREYPNIANWCPSSENFIGPPGERRQWLTGTGKII